MERIVITGALGQIGTELVLKCREIYGNDNVLATDIREPEEDSPVNNGPFEVLDVTNREAMMAIVENFKADTLMHMAALLSATAEKKSFISMGFKYGRSNERIKQLGRMNYIFTPSSIGAFGDSTLKKDTPQNTIQQPTTMYGVNKVAGELLCQYYFTKFVDTRSVRFPGLISHVKEPGGGTTDYAVETF